MSIDSHYSGVKKSGVFLACDGPAVSTTQLVKRVSLASGKKNKMIPIPKLFQNMVKGIKPNIHQRLFGNLEVDNTKTCRELNYIPEYTFEQGIKEMIDWYKSISR